MITITGRIIGITRYPHNTTHVRIATADGTIIAELDHATAEGLTVGSTCMMCGTITVERGGRFLVDVVDIERLAHGNQ